MKVPRWLIDENARKLLIIPPLLIGCAVFALLVANRQAPTRRPLTEASRTLRVIAVPKVDVVPRVIGHGTAEPGQVWLAIAEVKGRVIEVHEQLASGALLNAGAQLLRIDPTEYELAVAQLESDIQQANAHIAELEVNSTNYEASLKIENTSLALAEKELGRLRSLQPSAVADTEVDTKERDVLVQRQKVQNLENSIKLIPAQEQSLQAALAVKRSSLKQAEIDLEKTNIFAPFDCRLGKLSIEVGQFLTAGETLFEAHSTAATEIEAQIALHEARRLIDSATAPLLPDFTDTNALRDAVKLGVTVRLRSGDVSAEWKGRLERLREEFDSQTRTLGFIVAVDKPYEKIIPGRRPALVRGMYCEVELQGTSRENRVIIPRSALHNGHVYLLDADQRLQRRAVEIDFAQSNFICLKSGLNEGDTLVVSDPVPAIEGMLVEPVADNDLRQSLIQEATREGAVE